MKLTEALQAAKVALASDCHPYTECMDVDEPCHARMHRGLETMILAVEEFLAEQKRDAENLVGLADLRPWSGV